MKQVPTFTATIYVGLKVDVYDEMVFPVAFAQEVCQQRCDKGGLCVSFTETEFIYKNGSEPGCIIGLINYARFPTTEADFRETALELAKQLMVKLQQKRVSIVFSDDTIMLSNDYLLQILNES